MRDARVVSAELVRHVRPPKGCGIVLTERPIGNDSEPNWIATVDPTDLEHGRYYNRKVAELKRRDLGMDGSAVTNCGSE